MRFAVEIRYLVAPPQEAEYPADPRKSEQLPNNCKVNRIL